MLLRICGVDAVVWYLYSVCSCVLVVLVQQCSPEGIIYMLLCTWRSAMVFRRALACSKTCACWYDFDILLVRYNGTVWYTIWEECWYGMMVRFDILHGKSTVCYMVCWWEKMLVWYNGTVWCTIYMENITVCDMVCWYGVVDVLYG